MSVLDHTTPPANMTAEEALARTKALVPAIRERAVRAEQERRQPIETIQEIMSAGLARLLTPRRWRGYELGFDTFAETVIEVGKADASAAWCYGFLNIHAWLLAHFPDEAQRDVWQHSPDVALADSFVPAGKISRVENGYRVSGNWPFVSGIDYCEWFMPLGLVPQGDSFEPHVFLIPLSDYEIDDTWFVSGLKASGSKNVVVKDVFVPEHRAVSLPAMSEGLSPGAALNTHPMYRHPLNVLFETALVAPIIGATLGAYEFWCESARTKSTRLTGIPLTSFTHLQIRMAEISAEIASAQLLLQQNLEVGRSEGLITMDQRMQSHRNFAYIAQLCLRAIERIYLSSGGSANYDSNPLQRYWRDIHAMAVHAAIGFDTAGETYGMYTLGLPRNPRDPYV